jgi:two-component system chemotaxis response regulator CheB
MRTKLRALVVEDSLTVRRRLVEALSADPECEVVGEAADGRAAIDLCQRLRPSVVTLDMMLHGSTGLDVTRHVMAYCPTPILVVSSSFNRGEALCTYDALAAGAVDVLEKPHGGEPEGEWERRFVGAVKLVSRIPVITHVRGRLRPTPSLAPLPAAEAGRYRIVAMGASTGGPAAILAALRPLPASFPLPILLVLHTSEGFGATFAAWLGGKLALPVTHAVDGEPIGAPGRARVVIAPPGRHLVMRGDRLRATLDPERHACRPSVDVLFESVAAEAGPAAIGCLLTGMGRDGALGLLAMRRAGGVTIAQDEATSVIFGMPREAVRLDAASRVLPIGEVAAALSLLAWSRKEEG